MAAKEEAPVTPQHVPAGEELNDAIIAILKENESPIQPSTKQVQQILAKQNPSWHLQERRVAKFVKKQKRAIKAQMQQSNNPSGEEGSNTSGASRTKKLLINTGAAIKSSTKSVKRALTPKSSTGSRTSKSRVFTFRSKKKDDSANAVESSSSPDSKSTILTPIDSELSEAEAAERQLLAVKAETGDAGADAARGIVDIYEDDNTGEKQDCCACTGCVIL